MTADSLGSGRHQPCGMMQLAYNSTPLHGISFQEQKPPRKFSTGYNYFVKEHCQLHHELGRQYQSGELLKECASLWNKTTTGERKRYEVMAKEDRNRYFKELGMSKTLVVLETPISGISDTSISALSRPSSRSVTTEQRQPLGKPKKQVVVLETPISGSFDTAKLSLLPLYQPSTIDQRRPPSSLYTGPDFQAPTGNFSHPSTSGHSCPSVPKRMKLDQSNMPQALIPITKQLLPSPWDEYYLTRFILPNQLVYCKTCKLCMLYARTPAFMEANSSYSAHVGDIGPTELYFMIRQ